MVKVTDSLSHDYPYGKQSRESHGMWYTQVSGIWQTVWVEAVSKNCIKDLLITPSLTGINLKVNTEASRYTVTIENNDFKKTYTAKILISPLITLIIGLPMILIYILFL